MDNGVKDEASQAQNPGVCPRGFATHFIAHPYGKAYTGTGLPAGFRVEMGQTPQPTPGRPRGVPVLFPDLVSLGK